MTASCSSKVVRGTARLDNAAQGADDWAEIGDLASPPPWDWLQKSLPPDFFKTVTFNLFRDLPASALVSFPSSSWTDLQRRRETASDRTQHRLVMSAERPHP